MSVLVAATIGCVITAFLLVTFLYEPVLVAGFIYPVVTFGLMFGTHYAITKIRTGPDPLHLNIQLSLIIGGLLSVGVAYAATKVISIRDLSYAAFGMIFLTLISVALESVRTAKLKAAAERALSSAQEARQLADYGELTEADEQLQEALLTSELGYGSYHPQVATIVGYLADVMWKRKRIDAASRMYERAVLIYSTLGQQNARSVECLQRYAEHLERIDSLDKGTVVAKMACNQASKVLGRSAEYGQALLVLSEIQTAQEKIQEAYETSKKAASMLEKSTNRSHPLTLRAKSLVASQCVMLGRLAEGERIIREVILEKDRAKLDHDEDYLGLQLDLLIIQEKNKDTTASLTLQKAIQTFRSTVGPDYERADEILKRLPDHITKDAPEEAKTFLQALLEDNGLVARECLSKHESVLSYVDASGWTPLQWAVLLDRRDLAERLIAKGADHSYGAGTDLPALFLAARWRRKRLISALYQKEADIEITTFDGSRPIHGAVRSGDQFTYDTLASKGADLETPNKPGWNVLHEAAYQGDRKLMIQLISKGLDLNLQAGSKRETPLHAAVAGGHASTVEALIINGAELDLTCSAGRTPMRLAEQMARKDLVAIIEAHTEPPSTEEDEKVAE